MSLLAHIDGQPTVIALLNNALKKKVVSHAYLFCGPADVGKFATAFGIARAINCLSKPNQGCEDCDSCMKISAGTHPDVVVLPTQGASQHIPISIIRDLILTTLGRPSLEGKARFFFIKEATALQTASSNALLKILEDPPHDTYFILCTTTPDTILPTIRSRCQRINFYPNKRSKTPQSNTEEHRNILAQFFSFIAQNDFHKLENTISLMAQDKETATTILDEAITQLYKRMREAISQNNTIVTKQLANQLSASMKIKQHIQNHNANVRLAMDGFVSQILTNN